MLRTSVGSVKSKVSPCSPSSQTLQESKATPEQQSLLVWLGTRESRREMIAKCDAWVNGVQRSGSPEDMVQNIIVWMLENIAEYDGDRHAFFGRAAKAVTGFLAADCASVKTWDDVEDPVGKFRGRPSGRGYRLDLPSSVEEIEVDPLIEELVGAFCRSIVCQAVNATMKKLKPSQTAALQHVVQPVKGSTPGAKAVYRAKKSFRIRWDGTIKRRGRPRKAASVAQTHVVKA